MSGLGYPLWPLSSAAATESVVSVEIALGHLRRGEWEQAHLLVQDDDSKLGCWAHAIVHLQEGDTENARYWFGRAGRRFSSELNAELTALEQAIWDAQ